MLTVIDSSISNIIINIFTIHHPQKQGVYSPDRVGVHQHFCFVTGHVIHLIWASTHTQLNLGLLCISWLRSSKMHISSSCTIGIEDIQTQASQHRGASDLGLDGFVYCTLKVHRFLSPVSMLYRQNSFCNSLICIKSSLIL